MNEHTVPAGVSKGRYRLPPIGTEGLSMRWMARVLSTLTDFVYLIITVLALNNEDRPQGATIPVLVLLTLTRLATLVAWGWERLGGLTVIVLALALAVAASVNRWLHSASLLPSLVLSAPFLIVGVMFWLAGRQEATA